jgi:hypothetical protein
MKEVVRIEYDNYRGSIFFVEIAIHWEKQNKYLSKY